MNKRTEFETSVDIAAKEDEQRFNVFVKNFVEPWVIADPGSKDRQKKFKLLKAGLADLSYAAYTVPAAVDMLRRIPAGNMFKHAEKSSEVIALAHAMLHPGSLIQLGWAFYIQVRTAASEAMVARYPNVNLELMLGKLPAFPISRATREEEDHHDSLIDHDCEKVKDLSGTVPNSAKPFYLTGEQIRAAHPMRHDSDPDAWSAHNAALVMVSERYLKSDLVHLVTAALQFVPPKAEPDMEVLQQEFEAFLRDDLKVIAVRLPDNWYIDPAHDLAWISWCGSRGIKVHKDFGNPSKGEAPLMSVQEGTDVIHVADLKQIDEASTGIYVFQEVFVHHVRYKDRDAGNGMYWLQIWVDTKNPRSRPTRRIKARDGKVYTSTCLNIDTASSEHNWSAWREDLTPYKLKGNRTTVSDSDTNEGKE